MATDSRRGPKIDPENERDYHEAFLKLTQIQIDLAKRGLLDPTERDIVKSWEARKAVVG